MCINDTIFILKNPNFFIFLHPNIKKVRKNALCIATGWFLLVLSFKNYEPNFRLHN